MELRRVVCHLLLWLLSVSIASAQPSEKTKDFVGDRLAVIGFCTLEDRLDTHKLTLAIKDLGMTERDLGGIGPYWSKHYESYRRKFSKSAEREDFCRKMTTDPFLLRVLRSNPDNFATRTLFFVDLALEIYIWLLFADAVRYLLIGFNVVSAGSRVGTVTERFFDRVTGPARRSIIRLLPDLGDIDFSPIVLIVIFLMIRYVIALYILPNIS